MRLIIFAIEGLSNLVDDAVERVDLLRIPLLRHMSDQMSRQSLVRTNHRPCSVRRNRHKGPVVDVELCLLLEQCFHSVSPRFYM